MNYVYIELIKLRKLNSLNINNIDFVKQNKTRISLRKRNISFLH